MVDGLKVLDPDRPIREADMTGLASAYEVFKRQTDLLFAIGTCRSRTNADDRLPRAALGRVEGGDGVVEG